MPARVQIVVDVQSAGGGVLRAITSELGALGGLVEELTGKNVNWGNVAQQATQMIISGVKDALKVTSEYTEAVRDQMLISGQSADASSRFIQVLDDYQLSAEDAKTATRALTREGYAPTIETIAKLSGEYQKLTTVEEKNAFVQKNLGRTGQEWLNLLNQGPDAIMAMNDAVDKNLILTEANIQAYEDYRLTMDEFNDRVMALKVSIGNELIPVLSEMLDNFSASQRAAEIMVEQGLNPALTWSKEYKDALAQANAEQLAAAASASELAGELGIGAEVTAEATVNYKELIGSIQSAQSAIDSYKEKNVELAEQKRELLGTIEDLKNRGYREEGKAVQDVRAKIADLDKGLDANAKAHEKWAKQTIFSFAQARAAADGEISEGEGKVLIEIGQQLELFDAQTAEAMQNVNEAFSDLDVSDAEASVNAVRVALQELTSKPWTITVVADTSGVNLPSTAVTTSGSTEVSGPTVPTCFIAGTQILMSDGTTKNIEDIRPGDKVTSYHLSEAVVSTVEETFDFEADGYLLINGKLGVTPNHMIYANDKWIPAGELKTGDILTTPKGEGYVNSIEQVQGRVKVYDIHVTDEPHNYFAEGILVHNKQMGGTVYAGQPYLVGERGAEAFMPSQNGRVLGHAESLHALGLGGGGGQTNYFYGNVTLQVGEESAAGLLSVR